MSKVRTAVLILVSAILVVFAIGNRQLVPIDLWPFAYETQPIPVFMIFFLGILVGIALSAVVLALRGVKHYAELKTAEKEKEKLSQDVEALERELDVKPPKVEQTDYSEEGPGAKKAIEKQ